MSEAATPLVDPAAEIETATTTTDEDATIASVSGEMKVDTNDSAVDAPIVSSPVSGSGVASPATRFSPPRVRRALHSPRMRPLPARTPGSTPPFKSRHLSPLRMSPAHQKVSNDRRRQRVEAADAQWRHNKLRHAVRPPFDATTPLEPTTRAHGHLSPLRTNRNLTEAKSAPGSAPRSPNRTLNTPLTPITPLMLFPHADLQRAEVSDLSPAPPDGSAGPPGSSIWDNIPTRRVMGGWEEEKESTPSSPPNPSSPNSVQRNIALIKSLANSPERPTVPSPAHKRVGSLVVRRLHSRNSSVSSTSSLTSLAPYAVMQAAANSPKHAKKSSFASWSTSPPPALHVRTGSMMSSITPTPSTPVPQPEHDEVAETGKIRSRRPSLSGGGEDVLLHGKDAILVETHEAAKHATIRVGGATVVEPHEKVHTASDGADAASDPNAVFHVDTPRGSRKLAPVSSQAVVHELQAAPDHVNPLAAHAAAGDELNEWPTDDLGPTTHAPLDIGLDQVTEQEEVALSLPASSDAASSGGATPAKAKRKSLTRPSPAKHIRHHGAVGGAPAHARTREERLALADKLEKPLVLPIADAARGPTVHEYDAALVLLSHQRAKAAASIIVPRPREYAVVSGLLRKGALDIYNGGLGSGQKRGDQDDATRFKELMRKRDAKRALEDAKGIEAIAAKRTVEAERRQQWVVEERVAREAAEKRAKEAREERLRAIAEERAAKLARRRNWSEAEHRHLLDQLAASFKYAQKMLTGQLKASFEARGADAEWLAQFLNDTRTIHGRSIESVRTLVHDMAASGTRVATYPELADKFVFQIAASAEAAREQHERLMAQREARRAKVAAQADAPYASASVSGFASPYRTPLWTPMRTPLMRSAKSTMSTEKLVGLLKDIGDQPVESYTQLVSTIAERKEKQHQRKMSAGTMQKAASAATSASASRPRSMRSTRTQNSERANGTTVATTGADKNRRPRTEGGPRPSTLTVPGADDGRPSTARSDVPRLTLPQPDPNPTTFDLKALAAALPPNDAPPPPQPDTNENEPAPAAPAPQETDAPPPQ